MALPRTLALAALVFSSLLIPSSPTMADELTLERIFASPALDGPTLRSVRLAPDGSRVTFLRGSDEDRDRLDLWAYDPATDTTAVLIAANDILAAPAALSDEEEARRERARISGLSGIVEYRYSDDGRYLLFPLGGDIYVADLAADAQAESAPDPADGAAEEDAVRDGTEGVERTAGPADERAGSVSTPDSAGIRVRQVTSGAPFDLDPRLSPDGSKVAFVRDRDLWLADVASGELRALTDDGEGPVSNGMAEFIAQEEMGRDRGFWWSPDGAHIAFLRVDESTIEPSRRYEVDGDTITMIEQRYPYAGTPNARVELGVVTVETGDVRWLNLGPDSDIYIPRVAWHPAGDAVLVQRQSRDQKTLELLLHRLDDAEPRRILTEDSATWVNLHDDLRFLDGGESFVWSSERSGYRHLYLVETATGETRALTAGDWPVDALVAVDEDLGLVYFTAGVEGPTEQHLYRQSLASQDPEAVQRISRRSGWHEITFDSQGRVYLDLFSSTEQPPQLSLHSSDGDRLAWLVENRIDDDHPYAPFLADHRPTEFGVLAAEDGLSMHYRVVRPAGFDAEGTAQFPVIQYVYGGPTSRLVQNRWGRRHLIEQYWARRGYAVFSIDNRGIEGQGVAFQAPVYRNLGVLEVVDQKLGTEWLKAQPWVDPDRVGAFGWSYGGYMTLMMLMQHPGTYAAGASVAPVTDWALYDTHYTERYMGMPRTEDGSPAEAYERGNVLTYANALSDPMLLIHGMADDNVLFTHSTMLMQRLQEEAIDFDLMTYPGEKHAITGDGQRLHVYRQIDRFFDRHLRPGE
ncbi:S9 family peptidase [Halomonas denitrificans]|nr:S9 family peptidase [Halomonas denitrificans]